MTKLTALVAIFLLVPTLAQASLITLGTWGLAPIANDDESPFWDGASWSAIPGVGHLIAEPGLEYLYTGVGGPVAFAFDNPTISSTLLYNVTGRLGGILGRLPNGAWTYDSGVGVSDSVNLFEQYALFRVIEGAATRYILGIEDIPKGGDGTYTSTDADYNDYVVTFTLANPEQTPQPVPEPAILALFGAGLVGMGYRLKRRSRSR